MPAPARRPAFYAYGKGRSAELLDVLEVVIDGTQGDPSTGCDLLRARMKLPVRGDGEQRLEHQKARPGPPRTASIGRLAVVKLR